MGALTKEPGLGNIGEEKRVVPIPWPGPRGGPHYTAPAAGMLAQWGGY